MGALLILNLLLCVYCAYAAEYEVPDALIEPLSPRGFRISIPDDPGIRLFAIHAKINEELEGREGGTFSRDITRAKNGRWTFTDKVTELKTGDIIYYWTFVDYFNGVNKLGYVKDDQMYVVTGLMGDVATVKPTTARPANCRLSQTLLKGRQACTGQVIFQEDFPNNFLTEKKWDVDVRVADAPDYEFVLYTNNKTVIYPERNILHIKPTLTDNIYGSGFVDSKNELDLGISCTGNVGKSECVVTPDAYVIVPPVVSGAINTKRHFNFRYGIINIRAKFPKGDWIYPELYLNPLDNVYGSGYASGQIRIAFIKCNSGDSETLSGGCILGESEAARSHAIRKKDKNGINWSDDFHIFTVRWEPERIVLYVDNVQYGDIYPTAGGFGTLEEELRQPAAKLWKSGTVFAPFDEDMYLSIGVGVGGHNFYDSINKPWNHKTAKQQKQFHRKQTEWFPTWNENSELQVDYIKVTAL